MAIFTWIGIFIAVFISGIGVFLSYYFGEKKNKQTTHLCRENLLTNFDLYVIYSENSQMLYREGLI